MTSDVLLLLLFVLFLFLRWAICGSSELTTIEQNQKKKNTSVTRSILSQVRSGLEADFQQTLLVDEVKNDPVHVAVLWQRLEAFLVSLLVVSVPVLRNKLTEIADLDSCRIPFQAIADEREQIFPASGCQ